MIDLFSMGDSLNHTNKWICNKTKDCDKMTIKIKKQDVRLRQTII